MAAFLIAPDAAERLAPIGHPEPGPGRFILDLTDSPDAIGSNDRARIEALLPTLPCVTIALVSAVDEAHGSVRSLAALCDVVLDSEAKLRTLLEFSGGSPLASLAFVQLLRSSPVASTFAGLVAESFVYSTLQAGPEFARWQANREVKSGKAAAQEPACLTERDAGRLDIRFARSQKHNAFSRALRDGLVEALQLALADPSIQEVVLTGNGPSFCSGGDLDEFGSFPDPATAHAIRMTRSPALLLSRIADRARSEVHGACIGAGAELPAFCSRVTADESAYFRLPEVALGLVPGAGGTVSLPRRIGRQRTAWLGLSGATLDAQMALDWGLVDEVRIGDAHAS